MANEKKVVNLEADIDRLSVAASRICAEVDRLREANAMMLEALKNVKNLVDDGGPFIYERADHKPMTNGDVDLIDKAYIKLDAAIKKAETGE
jgi:hypothetical protein